MASTQVRLRGERNSLREQEKTSPRLTNCLVLGHHRTSFLVTAKTLTQPVSRQQAAELHLQRKEKSFKLLALSVQNTTETSATGEDEETTSMGLCFFGISGENIAYFRPPGVRGM